MDQNINTAMLKRLFDTGAHFAQMKSRRHPSMKPYLIGSKGQQEVIDLAKTVQQLEEAKTAMTALAREGKTILFVGGKVEIADLVRKTARDIGTPFVTTRWLGGTISNWNEIRKRVERLSELESIASGSARGAQYTKLERVKIERERQRLLERLDGITTLTKYPDALVVIDAKHEMHAIKEANQAGIPVIAVMSSDCDLKKVSYPIVANDASREAVHFILTELAEAFSRGRVI